MDEEQTLNFEVFQNLLLMLARVQIGSKYHAQLDPEEIVNQTLFDAYRQRDKFRGGTQAEWTSWLKRILSDNIKDAFKFVHRDKRDLNREERLPMGDWDQSCSKLFDLTCDMTSPSMKAIRHERELQLADALAQLPSPQRDAIEFHHLQGLSLSETAEMMGRTSPAVVGLLRRGLKRLRELLKEMSSCS